MLLDNRTRNVVKYYLPDSTESDSIAGLFQALADTTRVKLISALAITEMCVGDLSTVLGINQTTVSHQLKFLRSSGLVRTKRQGKVIFYSIADKCVTELMLAGVKQLYI